MIRSSNLSLGKSSKIKVLKIDWNQYGCTIFISVIRLPVHHLIELHRCYLLQKHIGTQNKELAGAFIWTVRIGITFRFVHQSLLLFCSNAGRKYQILYEMDNSSKSSSFHNISQSPSQSSPYPCGDVIFTSDLFYFFTI